MAEQNSRPRRAGTNYNFVSPPDPFRGNVLSARRKKFIMDFKSIDKKQIGSALWQNRLYTFLKKQDPAIHPEDVSRWLRNHTWINDPDGSVTIPVKAVASHPAVVTNPKPSKKALATGKESSTKPAKSSSVEQKKQVVKLPSKPTVAVKSKVEKMEAVKASTSKSKASLVPPPEPKLPTPTKPTEIETDFESEEESDDGTSSEESEEESALSDPDGSVTIPVKAVASHPAVVTNPKPSKKVLAAGEDSSTKPAKSSSVEQAKPDVKLPSKPTAAVKGKVEKLEAAKASTSKPKASSVPPPEPILPTPIELSETETCFESEEESDDGTSSEESEEESALDLMDITVTDPADSVTIPVKAVATRPAVVTESKTSKKVLATGKDSSAKPAKSPIVEQRKPVVKLPPKPTAALKGKVEKMEAVKASTSKSKASSVPPPKPKLPTPIELSETEEETDFETDQTYSESETDSESEEESDDGAVSEESAEESEVLSENLSLLDITV